MRKEGNGLEFISKGRRRRNEKFDFATFVPSFRQKNRMLHGSPKSLILQGKFRPASHAGGLCIIHRFPLKKNRQIVKVAKKQIP